jgi:hypothetical protein
VDRENERSLAEVAKIIGTCKWETSLQLREEDIIARSVTRSSKGTPRSKSFVSNIFELEA